MLLLFETAAGFALFKVNKEDKLEKSDDLYKDFETLDLAKKFVKLKAFSKFDNTTEALAAATALVESKLSKGLKKFLKKHAVGDTLAVLDAKLGGLIKEKLEINCVHNSSIQELARGVRAQLGGLIAELGTADLTPMSLGLSHSLSRYKLKFSPEKVDTMIVQAIGLLDDLDKELNTYAMRVREWYGWHFPEMTKIVADNIAYAKAIKAMGTRDKAAGVDFSGVLEQEVEDGLKAAAQISMGTEISQEDLDNILALCDQVIELSEYRGQLFDYLKSRMAAVAPNLTVLVGELVGARLIAGPSRCCGWGANDYRSCIGFNSCTMYMDGPPYSVVCPWLAVAGLLFTCILLVWNVNGAFIIGIFFTMFASWAKFPQKMSEGGLVPDKVVDVARFTQTAGAVDFNWGANTGELVGALFMFLYLDLVGSSITFVSLGQMAGVLNKRGDMPRSNIAFLADAFGTTLGGLLGSSALTTYVESASAMREGGRTGFTAVVCSLFFLASIALWPLFSSIPSIATGPILCLIGAVIFLESIHDIAWSDMTDAVPAFTTIMAMPFTHNIAYGVIAGLIMHVFVKFFTFKLFKFQRNWPGVGVYSRWSAYQPMFTSIPGWNVDPVTGEKLAEVSTEDMDLSLVTAYTALKRRKAGKAAAADADSFKGPSGTAKAGAAAGVAVAGDDSARGGVPGGGMV